MYTSFIKNKTCASGASNGFLQKKQLKDVALRQPLPTLLWPKLSIGEPGEVHEMEAHARAEEVMRDSTTQPVNFSEGKNNIVKKYSGSNEDGNLLRKENGIGSTFFAPPVVHDVLNSPGGKSLDTDTRGFMESRFNYDFSNVKIHDDDKAAESAGSINALAYTSGNNIVFNSGQYNPSNDVGKKLLAHELTHVIQQNERISRKPEQNPVETNYVGDISETITGLETEVSERCGDTGLKMLRKLPPDKDIKLLERIRKMLVLYFAKLEAHKSAPSPAGEAEIQSMREQLLLVLQRAGLSDLIGLYGNERNLKLIDCIIARLNLELFRKLTHSPGKERRLNK